MFRMFSMNKFSRGRGGVERREPIFLGVERREKKRRRRRELKTHGVERRELFFKRRAS